MKANEKLVWGALTGSALLIPIILALVMDSPWYLLLIVALLAVIGALWFFRDGRWEAASTSAPPSREREPAQAAEPLLEEVLTEVELPTARPDYAVIFSARVNWQPIPQPADEPPHADLAAVARHAVIERAASFVRDREPSDLGVARSALAAQLGGMQPDPTGKVRAQAANVALDLRADDVQRLRAESDLRKSDLAWQQDRDHKRNVMDYLQDDVLTSPARALVWWMAEHPGDIQGAVDRVGQLTRLSSVAQGRGDPSAAGPQLVPSPGARPAEHRDLTATRDLLSELFPKSQDKREFFARELARLADEAGEADYGRRVRQNFGLTPRVTETAPYPDDREPPDPEDEPPYPDDAESTTA